MVIRDRGVLKLRSLTGAKIKGSFPNYEIHYTSVSGGVLFLDIKAEVPQWVKIVDEIRNLVVVVDPCC